MAYKALYRRYRPNNFDEVMGQKYIIQTIKNSIINDKIGHAYLFSGPRGIGKTTIARIIAKAVNCPNAKDGNPCNEKDCPVCSSVNEGSAIDVVEIDAASNNGVEEMRSLLEKVNFLPAEFKYKIYIIDEVHMLSISAFNALLKTLEEPPLHVIFVLATTEPHRVPATILSRCQRFDFKPLSVYEIKEQLAKVAQAEQINIQDDALEVAAEAADGGMRDALSILDQLAAFGNETITAEDVNNVTGRVDNHDLIKLLKSIAQGKASDSLDIMNNILNTGKEVSVLVQSLLSLCRDVILFQNVKSIEPPHSLFNNEDFIALAQNTKRFKLFKYVDILNDVQNKIKYTNSPKIYLEVGIVKMIANETPVVTNNNVTVDLSEVNEKIYQLELQIKEQNQVKIPEDLGEFKDYTKSKLEFLEEMVSRCAVPPKDLEERIEILEENEFGDEIEKRLSALEASIGNSPVIEAKEEVPQDNNYLELMNRLAKLEEAAEQNNNVVSTVVNNDFEARLNQLENTFNSSLPSILDQRYDELQKRLDNLNTPMPQQNSETINLDDIRLQLEAFQNTFVTADELNQKLQGLSLEVGTPSSIDLSDVYSRLNDLEKSLASLNAPQLETTLVEPNTPAFNEQSQESVDEDFFNMIDEEYHETTELDKVKENYLSLFNLVQSLKAELGSQKNELQAQITNIETLKTSVEQLQTKGNDEEAFAEMETKIISVKEYAVKLGTRLSVLEDNLKNNKIEVERTITPRPQPIQMPPRETQQELNQVVTPTEAKVEEPAELPEGQVDDTTRVYNIKTIENILHQSRDRRNMDDKEKINNNWARLGNFVPQSHLGVANTLSGGKVAVNGGNYLIIIFEAAKVCNQLMTADYHSKAIQVIRTALQKDYDFIALPRNTWLEIVQEYKSQYHMGVKYPTLSPINNPELKVINVVNKENFKTTSAQNYDRAKQIFGQNLIKEVKN